MISSENRFPLFGIMSNDKTALGGEVQGGFADEGVYAYQPPIGSFSRCDHVLP